MRFSKKQVEDAVDRAAHRRRRSGFLACLLSAAIGIVVGLHARSAIAWAHHQFAVVETPAPAPATDQQHKESNP
jgi:hypothetical protein